MDNMTRGSEYSQEEEIQVRTKNIPGQDTKNYTLSLVHTV